MIKAMPDVTLPPDVERFATEAVAAGRYKDVSAVIIAGARLLQRQDAARAAFAASLDAAIAEGERDGFFTIEEVERDMDAVIAEAAAGRR